jgi:hypothetical protein
MQRRWIGLFGGLALGLGLWATQAVAGARYGGDVTVQATYRYAFGGMGSARGSSDTTQYIGCYVQPTIAVCHAMSAGGTFAMCSTTDPNKMALARALDSGSWLFLDWDANGTCTNIQVSNYSYYGNKAP